MSTRLTGMTARGATVALVLLAVMLVGVELGSVAIAHSYGHRLSGDADSFWEWNNYMQSPPDVLFVGDSRVREDVNLSSVQDLLDKQPGPKIRIGKIGFDSAQPRNLVALMYRVTHQAVRPKLIFYGMSEYQYGSAYNFDPSYDFWNMELPLDWGYFQLTYEVDTGRQDRLVRGYLNPLAANQKILETGAPCTIYDIKNVIASHTPIRLAGALEPLYPCTTPYSFADLTMSPESRDRVFAQYREIFATNFSYSEDQASYARRAVGMARSAGIQVAFFVPPQYRIDELNPSAYAEFESQTTSLAREMNIDRYDFHADLRYSQVLWADPAHLNGVGTVEFAPQVTAMIVAELSKST
jgi:hypothetical protein